MVEADDNAPRPEADEERTTDLVREALGETRELVRLEVALARDEIRDEIAHAKRGAIAVGVAVAAVLVASTMLMVALAAAFSPMWLASLIIAGVWLAIGTVAGIRGRKTLPRSWMAETKDRLQSDFRALKERVA